ncbi:unnamed protein product [Timema podura]|uniref:Uncharacterized protein n=1 Tax=Timema podura TaxID=61482 RepID=A0ABN7PJM0_TIMPD|nr:unnamed protein product [Timema podura]
MVLCCRMVAKTRQVTGISFQFLNSLQQHSGKVHCTTLKYIRSIGTTKCLGAFKYSDKHEWVKMEGNVGTIGITHYAQVSKPPTPSRSLMTACQDSVSDPIQRPTDSKIKLRLPNRFNFIVNKRCLDSKAVNSPNLISEQ